MHPAFHEAVLLLLEHMLQCPATEHSAMCVHCMLNLFQGSITVSACLTFSFIPNSDCSVPIWWVDPAWIPGVHQANLSHPSIGQMGKNTTKLLR